MNSNKKYILVFMIFIISIYICLSYFIEYNLKINLVFLVLELFGVYFLLKDSFKTSNNNLKFKDRLFKSLIENSDTVYIITNYDNNELLYLSNNTENILGIKYDSKDINKTMIEILSIPSIKNEINTKNDYHISQLFLYDNPKYNHECWLKVKTFIYEKDDSKYNIIQIIDSTKEHEHQHLLLNQAMNIKSRESQLNQITQKSYDMELNINLVNGSYDLKYYKKDNLYFGKEGKGNYKSKLDEIVNLYINKNDMDKFLDNFSLDKLKSKFNKFEFDTITFRYRIGNEIKNNTWLESTIFFLNNRNNSKVSILTKNVTENAENIREQNVMLQNALNDAKLASKQKTDLISTISHDIRTPLTNIIGLSDTLLSSNLNNDQSENIKNINDSSKEILKIVDGLINIDNLKQSSNNSLEEYSIYKLFNKLEEETKEYIGNKNIKLDLVLNPNLPVILYGNQLNIKKALTHILNNAIRNTEEGIVKVVVNGNKLDENVKLEIQVSDTGVGISQDKIDNIINNKSTSNGLGTVKKLMKEMGGTLEIESKENEYTKVTISFIQKIVEDNKIRTMINNNKTAEVFSLKGKRVLLVDDNKLNLKVTSKLLSPFELDVTLLETGEEAIEIAKNEKFDLIMLDQMMPGMDGIETMENFKKIPGFSTPIVVLTADAMNGQKEKYLATGFDDYISKPIDKSELSRILAKFLKKNQ